ncbi:uncharacterized protein LOC128286834 [Gossypium arboreum]|uniref:uncharacterized protein LOC128286834 n=1 Tax=Gossypium arboreum TaxID=29729 RepID=UPI0022F17687|nr:uncharacterized protein LOC128286834 [Gossypium arboreum]
MKPEEDIVQHLITANRKMQEVSWKGRELIRKNKVHYRDDFKKTKCRKDFWCVLMQDRKVITYAFRQLKMQERNYLTHDVELVLWFLLKIFRDAIYFDCVIDYHPGKANVVADALSRKVAIELQAMFSQFNINDYGSLLAELKIKPVMFDRIKSAQLEDDKLVKKREMVQNGILENFSIDDYGHLRFHNQICISNVFELKELIFCEAYDNHFALHPGGTKMYRDLGEFY